MGKGRYESKDSKVFPIWPIVGAIAVVLIIVLVLVVVSQGKNDPSNVEGGQTVPEQTQNITGNTNTASDPSGETEPSQPAQTEPAVTQPSVQDSTEPEQTEPEQTEPAVTQPSVQDPTEPEQTEPAATQPSIPVVERPDAEYEKWLSAAMIVCVSMEHPDFALEGVYAASATTLKDKYDSAGVYIVFSSGGTRMALHSKAISEERTASGTKDISTEIIGFATFDRVDPAALNLASMEQLELEELSELISQSLLVSVYTH